MEFRNQNLTQEKFPNASPNLECQIPFGYMNPSQMNAPQFLPHFGLHRVNAPQPVYSSSNQDMSTLYGLSSQDFSNAPTTSKPRKGKGNPKKPVGQQANQATRCSWSMEEDVALTKAYLYVTSDPIVGIEQSGGTMWDRVLEAYKNNVGENYDGRNSNSLRCHWKPINKDSGKFYGYYESLERAHQSGIDIPYVITEAKYLYEGMEGSTFKFEHCWVLLKENSKWRALQQNKTSSKKAKVTENNSVDAPANEVEKNDAGGLGTEYDNEDDRPLGRKSSKESKKRMQDQKSMADVLRSFQTTLEKQHSASQQNLDMRERMLTRELELREKSHKLKEEADKRKARAEKRQEQERIMNTDLNTLQPILQAAYEKMQQAILKEWEQEGLFGDALGTDLNN